MADDDSFIGGSGRDLIAGFEGNDLLIADTSAYIDNIMSASEYGDWITGGEGADIIYGSNASDLLCAGGGSDYIVANGGNNLILGDGDYLFSVVRNNNFKDNATSQRYDPKTQTWIKETARASRLDQKTFDWHIEYNQDRTDYEIIYACNFNQETGHIVTTGAGDRIFGGTGNDFIVGQYGDDEIHTGGGDDIVYGDDNRDLSIIGNDSIYLDSGNNRVFGGGGSDSYYLKSENFVQAYNSQIDDDGFHPDYGWDNVYLDGKNIADYE